MSGIDWLRWHHGSVTDPKFGVVAKRANARLGDVVTMWAAILEAASAADDRGNAGTPDFDSLDYLLDMEDGTAQRIYEQMCKRNLIDAATGRVVSWEKRQPKREREDDTATERKRRQRERERGAAPSDVTPEDDDDSHVTPRHATSRQKTPRGEESREDDDDGDTRAQAQGDAAETPGDWLQWAEFFGAECGVDVDPNTLHDRKKFRPLADAWIKAGVTLGQMRKAVEQARADSIEPIAYLPSYVDRVLATLNAPRRAPPQRAGPHSADRKSRQLSMAAALTGADRHTSPSQPQSAEVVDVESRVLPS